MTETGRDWKNRMALLALNREREAARNAKPCRYCDGTVGKHVAGCIAWVLHVVIQEHRATLLTKRKAA